MQISKILISIIVICLIVSACNPVLKHTSDLTSDITLPGSTVHSPEKINGTDLKPVEYPQQKKICPVQINLQPFREYSKICFSHSSR